MKTEQHYFKNMNLTAQDIDKVKVSNPQIVFAFGGVDFFKNKENAQNLHKALPNAVVIGCSTAGEIYNKGVADNSLVLTSLHSDNIRFKTASQSITNGLESEKCGQMLAEQLNANDLTSVFVVGRGLDINGTGLVDGMRKVFGKNVIITGGLAGDAGAFKQTFTLLNGETSDQSVVAFGLYGNGVKIGYGSVGGWKPFGPARKVTKSIQNVMYELDGEPALSVYKKYLGDDAKGLPASGLRYPFALLNDNEDNTGVIRTILAVDEAAGSLTFAGDIPQNKLVRLMHADMNGLVDGAKKAAESSILNHKSSHGLGLLISCVGRKIVLGDDIDNEIDAVRAVLGGNNHITGFYSYGEICPMAGFTECKLHNQTMTITWFYDGKN